MAQHAARRVAEENRQLRKLLNCYGFGDGYIASYLHSRPTTQPDTALSSHYTAHHPAHNPARIPSDAVQSLQHAITPRKPVYSDLSVPYPAPTPKPRETPIASLTMSNLSVLERVPVSQGRLPPLPLSLPHETPDNFLPDPLLDQSVTRGRWEYHANTP